MALRSRLCELSHFLAHFEAEGEECVDHFIIVPHVLESERFHTHDVDRGDSVQRLVITTLGEFDHHFEAVDGMLLKDFHKGVEIGVKTVNVHPQGYKLEMNAGRRNTESWGYFGQKGG